MSNTLEDPFYMPSELPPQEKIDDDRENGEDDKDFEDIE